jgi:hypothetical protein
MAKECRKNQQLLFNICESPDYNKTLCRCFVFNASAVFYVGMLATSDKPLLTRRCLITCCIANAFCTQ